MVLLAKVGLVGAVAVGLLAGGYTATDRYERVGSVFPADPHLVCKDGWVFRHIEGERVPSIRERLTQYYIERGICWKELRGVVYDSD